jgi:multiple sugar transport system substrate-binding protein
MIQLLGAGAALPTLASLAACSPGGASVSGGTPSGKIVYAYNGTAAQAKGEQAQFSAFTKANPKVQLTAQGIAAANWAGFADTIATRIAGGTQLDVIDVAIEGQGIFRTKDLVKNLDPFIAKDKSVIDNFYADMDPTLKKLADRYSNTGGKTVYMVGGFNTVCVWCNIELFQKAGVDLPDNDEWTWDDYEAAAAKIKAKTGAFMAIGNNAQFNGIMPWLLTNGASTLNADWSKPTIDSDAAIEAAEFCAMMVQKGYFSKPAGGTTDEPALMNQNKIATLYAGRWQLSEFQAANKVSNIKIVKFPKKKMAGSPIGWDGYPILSSSQNPDAAWEFVKFLTTKRSWEAISKGGGTAVPPRKSVAQSSAFLDNTPKGMDLLYDAVSYSTAVPSPAKGNLTQNAVEAAWLQIISGSVSAETGLKQLSEQLSTLL